MKALVINLDKETKRLEFQAEQLNILNIDFQRVPAFKITDENYNIFTKYSKSWQRPLSISEVSCFLSHTKAWEIILSENKPMLVLEDDAWLTNNVPCILQNISKYKDIDYVTLEITSANRKKLVEKKATNSFCDVNLYRLYQGRSGAGGYILWPTGAKKLLTEFKKGKIGLADKFINAQYSLRAYQIEPACIIQLDQCNYFGILPPLEVKTTITNKITSTQTVLSRLLFRKRRIVGEMKIGINFLKNYTHSTRRRISLSPYFKNTNKT